MPTRYICEINSVKRYQGDTRKIILSLPEGNDLKFFAGQYLQIITSEKKFPFSIASSPKDQKQLELHIKPTPESEDSRIIESIIDSSEVIEIEAPLGNCWRREMLPKVTGSCAKQVSATSNLSWKITTLRAPTLFEED